MKEQGLWRLFFATGLPEAYLAIRDEKNPLQEQPISQAKTAFHSTDLAVRRI